MSKKEILGVVILILFFLVGVFISREFNDTIVKYFNFGFMGMFVYFLAGIIATVIAPVSTLPLIPVAVTLWGPFLTAVLSIVSWSVGAIIAFIIARRFGKPIVSRFVNLKPISKFELVLGEKYIFWDIVFLRMAVPVDILSYALGLFSSIKIETYILATVIGITPFAFVFAYASQGSSIILFIAGILIMIALYFGYKKIKHGKTH